MDLHTTVENMFAPARHPGLVGVELELIPVTDTPLPCPVAPVWLAAGFDAGFVRAAAAHLNRTRDRRTRRSGKVVWQQRMHLRHACQPAAVLHSARWAGPSIT